MDVMAAIRGRRSIRKYESRPLAEETLRQVLEAARLAPSARNRQEWRFVVVRDPSQIRRVTEAAGQPFIGTAPVIIAGVALNPERVMRCGVPTYAVDLTIALTNMMLAATALGLGTCWIGSFDQEEVKRVLAIPAHYMVAGLVPLGYPAENPEARPRKQLSEIVSYDYF
ncbi:nitroreductase family protein [Capillibacterium thermochitinicola]|uniref:Nitroreductase family protein n=1 Tax=Capillibacterium thermochitinicola TaxID=2699427 RepID=A0A8J6I0X0_9FIRM|nr:nitroreductase family protein [Capillibacterium thermochitinicola]MBA2132269.1 nitroreductase family protein [Capillibacterium thermochitinicola]